MKNLLIALAIFLTAIGTAFSQVNVQFTQNNQYQVWNDSVFNSNGYYCNTDLIAYHDFSTGNGDVITKWVWVFNGSTNYDTVVMTPSNYQMHVWVYYPNAPGSYQTTLTVYALDSCNTEYSSSVTVTVNLGFVAITGATHYQMAPWDSATLKSYGNYGPGTFVWSRNDTIIGQTSNSDSSQITVNQFGYYVVKYQNTSGCEIEDWILVDILPPAGTFCAQLAVGDSTNLGGGYFCNQDSLMLYDMSWLYTTGQIYHWRWRIKSADDQVIVQQFDFNQSNYLPNFMVYFPDSTAVYRIELAVSSYAGPTSTVNVGVHLGFADVIASSDVAIMPGDSATLSAMTNHGSGNFIWYKNGNFLGYTLDSSFSTMTVSDTGTYLVVYHNNGCDALDEVKVTWAVSIPAPDANFAANSASYSQSAYFCNTPQVAFYNLSTGVNITKSVWVVTQQNQTSTITLTGANAMNYITVNWIPGNDHIDLVKLFVYSFDSICNIELVDSIQMQIFMGFSDIVVDDPIVELLAGSNISLHAYTTFGPGNFIWLNQDGDTLGISSNAIQSSLSVADTGAYTVNFVNVLGNCENIATIHVIYSTTTSVSSLSAATVKIYPNPAVSKFTIENFSGKLEIFSATGQFMLSQEVSETMDFISADWQPGFYFLRLTPSTGKTETVKLVKN